MKTIKISIILGALALMSSCGVYRSYTRPAEISTDSLYRTDTGTAVITDTTQNLANLPWRELFTDSLLQSLIETGLEQNSDLLIAGLRVEAAQATLRAARLSNLPTISASPQGGISRTEAGGTLRTHSELLSASWEIDLAGRIRNTNRQAQAELMQSEDYRQAVQTRLIATIASNYYTLVMLYEQQDIARQTVDNWKDNVRTLAAMKNAGMTTQAAVSQAEANAIAVEAGLVDLDRQITELENTFSALLGNPSQSISVSKGTLATVPLPVLSVGLPLELLANRPDVRQAENSLRAAFYGTNISRSAFYPSITLGGSAGWANSIGGAVTNPAQFIVSAVGSLVQPLFNQGRLRANLRISEARQQEVQLEFQQALLDAGVEVNNALAASQSARERSVLFDRQIEALERAVLSTRLLMQYSSNTYLEVLVAEQSLLDAQLTRIENRFDYVQSVITLYRALGGGAK